MKLYQYPPFTVSTSITGVATEVTQLQNKTELQGINTELDNIKALLPTSLGQKTKAGSLAVTIASDQDPLDVDLPDYAKETKQDDLIAKLPSTLGQKTSANSLAVVISSDQPPLEVDLPGYALDSSLSAIDTSVDAVKTSVDNIAAQLPATIGQKTKATSLAVTLSSDEDPIDVNLPGYALDSTLTTIDGKLPATLGQKTKANSLAVTLASDSDALPVSQAVNENGDFETKNNITTLTSFVNPVDAIGFILSASIDNTDNIRWGIGSSNPTTSAGMILPPGASTVFVPCKIGVKVISVSGTQEATVIWVRP